MELAIAVKFRRQCLLISIQNFVISVFKETYWTGIGLDSDGESGWILTETEFYDYLCGIYKYLCGTNIYIGFHVVPHYEFFNPPIKNCTVLCPFPTPGAYGFEPDRIWIKTIITGCRLTADDSGK